MPGGVNASEAPTRVGCSPPGEPGRQPVLTQVPYEAGVAFRQFVDNSPDAEALLWHISTVSCLEQQQRLLVEWKNAGKIKYESEHYPMEGNWFIQVVLPNRKPKRTVLWMHQKLLHRYGMSIFSNYQSNGLLGRIYIPIIVADLSNPIACDAFKYKIAIIDHGGNSAVLQAPDLRKDAINVVLGNPKPSWAFYFTKLYSIHLLYDAMRKQDFDETVIDKFLVPLKPLPTLNLKYISAMN